MAEPDREEGRGRQRRLGRAGEADVGRVLGTRARRWPARCRLEVGWGIVSGEPQRQRPFDQSTGDGRVRPAIEGVMSRGHTARRRP